MGEEEVTDVAASVLQALCLRGRAWGRPGATLLSLVRNFGESDDLRSLGVGSESGHTCTEPGLRC